MNSDYRIEKDRRSVVLTTIGGERISGEMFVQTYARHRHGREEPPDIMNDDDPFFPLAVGAGDTLLIAKERVCEVEVARQDVDDDDEEDVRGATSRRATIELTLTGGVVRVGAVYLEVPFDRPRLLDYLNRCSDRFIALDTAEGLRLINRRMIERVRPLD